MYKLRLFIYSTSKQSNSTRKPVKENTMRGLNGEEFDSNNDEHVKMFSDYIGLDLCIKRLNLSRKDATAFAPTVSYFSIIMATMSLVPTPSMLETMTGSLYLLRSIWKRPPKPPTGASISGLRVAARRGFTSLSRSVARSISTPAFL